MRHRTAGTTFTHAQGVSNYEAVVIRAPGFRKPWFANGLVGDSRPSSGSNKVKERPEGVRDARSERVRAAHLQNEVGMKYFFLSFEFAEENCPQMSRKCLALLAASKKSAKFFPL